MGRVAECLHWPTHNLLLDVPTVSPVFGLEVLGSYRVTVPTQHSHWLLLLSLFFFSSFKAAATSKDILYREVKCTYPSVSRSPSLFRARKILDATWWWLSHSLSFFFQLFLLFFLEMIFIFFYHTRHHSSVTSIKMKLSWTLTNHNIPPNL